MTGRANLPGTGSTMRGGGDLRNGRSGVLIPWVLAVLSLAACASPRPQPPASTDPAVIARCRDLLYIARMPRGPPNWSLYDSCLRGLPATW